MYYIFIFYFFILFFYIGSTLKDMHEYACATHWKWFPYGAGDYGRSNNGARDVSGHLVQDQLLHDRLRECVRVWAYPDQTRSDLLQLGIVETPSKLQQLNYISNQPSDIFQGRGQDRLHVREIFPRLFSYEYH